MRKAIVIGGTGLTGKQLIIQLAQLRIKPEIVCLHRKQVDLGIDGVENVVVDFTKPSTLAPYFTAGSWVFCCVGTTMAIAKSREAFIKVDFDIPLLVGKLAKASESAGYSLISSAGANPEGLFFYSRTKGDIESALQELALPALHIFRPGMLLGQRNNERLGEKIGRRLAELLKPFFKGPFASYRSIGVNALANSMIRHALLGTRGVQFFEGFALE